MLVLKGGRLTKYTGEIGSGAVTHTKLNGKGLKSRWGGYEGTNFHTAAHTLATTISARGPTMIYKAEK
jgi:hypothetical protein